MPVAYSTILLTVSALTAFFSVPYLRTTRNQFDAGKDDASRQPDTAHKNNHHGTKGDVLNNVPDRMGEDFFIIVDIAGNDVDVLSSLALRKSGQWYALYFISQE